MEKLGEKLADALKKTSFAVEYSEARGNGKRSRVSRPDIAALELAGVYEPARMGIAGISANPRSPKQMISKFAAEVQDAL